MNIDKLKADLRDKLDVDDNGKLDIKDVAAYINSSAQHKLYAVGIGCFIAGVLIGRFVL